MKKLCLISMCVLALLMTAPLARAQSGAKQGPPVVRDPDMEKDSLHNLEVARQYFKLRKAYVAALQRCEEIIAGNPTFSRIDEALFMAGESSLYLSQSKGKQMPSLYVRHDGAKKVTLTPDQFRDDARDYLSQLVNDYPDSKFRDEALEDLKALGGPKPKDSKQ
jgi:outer membrane protein assembly factor BamD (BamD/ComL family)